MGEGRKGGCHRSRHKGRGALLYEARPWMYGVYTVGAVSRARCERGGWHVSSRPLLIRRFSARSIGAQSLISRFGSLLLNDYALHFEVVHVEPVRVALLYFLRFANVEVLLGEWAGDECG